MEDMHISLPPSVCDMIRKQVASGPHGNASAYIRSLIERDERGRAEQRLESLVLEGLESGAPIVMDEQFFESLDADLDRRIEAHRRMTGR